MMMGRVLTIARRGYDGLVWVWYNVVRRVPLIVIVALWLVVVAMGCGGGDDGHDIDSNRSLTIAEWCEALPEESPELIPIDWTAEDLVEDCVGAGEAGWTRDQLRAVYEGMTE